MEPETPANSEAKEKGVWQSLREWIQVIAIALVISLPIRFFIAEPFVVNGPSMDPTFKTGQFLIVDRVSYRFESPKRGDVIVFEYPKSPNIYYIKRIIGLPGEIINIKDGKVTITTSTSSSAQASTTSFELNESYVAALHISHENFHQELTSDQYFVMGDNRAESSDSRLWGPLEKKFIVGRPVIRLFPITTVSIWPGEHRQ